MIYWKDLSPNRRRLVKLAAHIRFGEIKNMPVYDKEPQGSDEIIEDCRLLPKISRQPIKPPAILPPAWDAFFEKLDELEDCTLYSIKIQDGLPTFVRIKSSFSRFKISA